MRRAHGRAYVVVRVLLVLVASATLVSSGASSAREAPKIGGYKGIVQADGLHAFYNPAGVLPLSPPVDAGVPDAYATIASGPATFARASAADPGDLLANPDALLAQGAPPPYKPGTVPAYPYRAVAGSATTQSAESSPAPGLDARANADDAGSVATATMPGSSAPAVATFGTMTSTASTSTDGSIVTLHGHTEISAVHILHVITIGSIVTDITATSDGTAMHLAGGTVVSDASVLGTPVEIDDNGVHPKADASTTTTSPIGALTGGGVDNLNDALAQMGLHITLSGPKQLGDDTAGQLTSDGLRIDFELSDRTFPALKQVLSAIPALPPSPGGAPGLADVITLAEARHLVALEIGRGSVSLTARPSRSLSTSTIGSASPTVSSPPSNTFARPSSGAAAPSIAAAAPPAPSESIGEQRPASPPVGAAIGGLVVLVLLAQPFLGDLLGRGSAAVLSGAQPVECPWEEL